MSDASTATPSRPVSGGCCSPSAGDRPAGGGVSAAITLAPDRTIVADVFASLVPLEGGELLMGSDAPDGYREDGEGPIHVVHLSPFRVDCRAVTNARFATFVEATGDVTDAERYGWSFVFGGLLPEDFPPTRSALQAPWWRQVYGADWSHPEGPQSDVSSRAEHPVVHVSWNDAMAFCAWSGTRLPTEAEWEYAARGGLVGQRFPWGSELQPGGEHRMNVFQGRFPGENTCADGYAATAPTDAFAPNAYGLHNMTGNVWEWCGDWFDPSYYPDSALDDPRGPDGGTNRAMRGGSYLCHASYCKRYRVDARSANEPSSSTGNLGFRVACDAAPSQMASPS
jgi:sulfatase modifying factor 1